MTEQSLNRLCTVIIRSANERSVNLCLQLIQQQGIRQENVEVVQVVPFSEAMRTSFSKGIEFERKWTLCVDADVFLRSNSIRILIEFAEKQPANVCEIQGAILDKFFGGARSGGIHLYRTELLPKAILCIPDASESVRPEFTTLQRMSQQGFPWAEIPYVVGLHDFEQYYSDIYRKCFVHGHKHLKFAELLVDFWRTHYHHDPDYQVALLGFCAGIQHHDTVSINRNASYYDVDLQTLGLCEKSELDLGDWSTETIDRTLSSWNEPESYGRFFPTWRRMYQHVAPSTIHQPKTMKDFRDKLGLIKGTTFAAGRVLERLGKRIQRICNPE